MFSPSSSANKSALARWASSNSDVKGSFTTAAPDASSSSLSKLIRSSGSSNGEECKEIGTGNLVLVLLRIVPEGHPCERGCGSAEVVHDDEGGDGVETAVEPHADEADDEAVKAVTVVFVVGSSSGETTPSSTGTEHHRSSSLIFQYSNYVPVLATVIVCVCVCLRC